MNKNIQSLISHIHGECYTPTSITFYENSIMYDFTIIYTKYTYESKFYIEQMISIKNCNNIKYNTCVSNVISLYKHYLMTFNIKHSLLAISEHAIHRYVETKNPIHRNQIHVFNTCIIAPQINTMYNILTQPFSIYNKPTTVIVN